MKRRMFDDADLSASVFSDSNPAGTAFTTGDLSGTAATDAGIEGRTIFGREVRALMAAEVMRHA